MMWVIGRAHASRSPMHVLAFASVAVVAMFLATVTPTAHALSAGPPLPRGFRAPTTPEDVGTAPPTPAFIPSAAVPNSSKGPALPSQSPSSLTPAPPVSTGRGLFFNNTGIPFPHGPANLTCIYHSTCVKNANDPSVNVTSQGVLAVAYTAYTNDSPCRNVSYFAESEIGVTLSKDGGANWSSPIYLGNADCQWASQYASAWEPSLTSLSNGTLVLAFVAFNLSNPSSYLPLLRFGPSVWNVRFAALMLTESYDDGANWSDPVVLNSSSNAGLDAQSFTPEGPSITAFGDTVYLTWMNYTEEPTYTCCGVGVGSSQVHLLVSSDGGRAWGPMINLTNVVAPGGASVGVNPDAITDSSGDLFVAYSTNWSFWPRYPIGCTSPCYHGASTADVVVARSSNNGSSFADVTVAHQIMNVSLRTGSMSSMRDPSPRLVYGGPESQLFVAWSGGYLNDSCSPCFWNSASVVEISNSSDLGRTWSAARLVSSSLLASGGQREYNPALAMTSDGTLHLEMSYIDFNSTACYPLSYTCSEWEVYLSSTDNGSTFSLPITIDSNATGSPTAPDGTYVSMASAGNQVWLTWSREFSTAAPTSYTYFPDTHLCVQVTVSTIYRGPGINLSFQETGLARGTPWTVNLLGNIRAGYAPTALNISGVPPAVLVAWTVPDVDLGYGMRDVANHSRPAPVAFSTSTTIPVNFSELVLLNIETVPNIEGCGVAFSLYCWDSTFDSHENYLVAPEPAQYWVPSNSTQSEAVIPSAVYCIYFYCYDQFLNLSFQSWTGEGAGSVNSTGLQISFTPRGPVNETANFQLNGTCLYYDYSTPPLSCTDFNQTLNFQESGLPANVTWSVTLWGDSGIPVTASSNSSFLSISSPSTIGTISYAIWTIPTGTAGQYWIGTGSPSDPISLPLDRVVNVTFTRGSPVGTSFPTEFATSQLPGSTPWTLDLASELYGVESGNDSMQIGGGTYSINGEPVYLSNGTGYYVSAVAVESFVMNQTSAWTNSTTVPDLVTVQGPSIIELVYSAEYWATVVGSTGGRVTPASQWVRAGAPLPLNASASVGYSFIGWTGIGKGSATGTSETLVARPVGPITELATFQAYPPRTWTVTVNAVGLPAGTAFSVTIGGDMTTGSGTIHLSGLMSGNYSVSFPYAYPIANSTRFVPTHWTSSFALTSVGRIAVGSNGTLNVTFVTEHLLTVTSTGPGTVTPSPGVGWWSQGATPRLVATPATGSQLAGWFGTGHGSISTMDAQQLVIVPTMAGPVTETAQFVPRTAAPPRTFQLSVDAQGLPAGARWDLWTGSTGTQETGPDVVLFGLNGTYTLSVTPVTVASGVRYVPDRSSVQVDVTGNASVAIAFTEEFYLTVQASRYGAVVPWSGWHPAGAKLVIAAISPDPGWRFDSWIGTGNGSYSGTASSITLTLDAPVTESAQYVPSSGVPFIPVVALLEGAAAGLVVLTVAFGATMGTRIRRRRSRR